MFALYCSICSTTQFPSQVAWTSSSRQHTDFKRILVCKCMHGVPVWMWWWYGKMYNLLHPATSHIVVCVLFSRGSFCNKWWDIEWCDSVLILVLIFRTVSVVRLCPTSRVVNLETPACFFNDKVEYIVTCQGGGVSSKTHRRSADKTRSLNPLVR